MKFVSRFRRISSGLAAEVEAEFKEDLDNAQMNNYYRKDPVADVLGRKNLQHLLVCVTE